MLSESERDAMFEHIRQALEHLGPTVTLNLPGQFCTWVNTFLPMSEVKSALVAAKLDVFEHTISPIEGGDGWRVQLTVQADSDVAAWWVASV